MKKLLLSTAISLLYIWSVPTIYGYEIAISIERSGLIVAIVTSLVAIGVIWFVLTLATKNFDKTSTEPTTDESN